MYILWLIQLKSGEKENVIVTQNKYLDWYVFEQILSYFCENNSQNNRSMFVWISV